MADDKAPQGLAAAAKPAAEKPGSEPDLEGYNYRVILHGGAVLEVISKYEPAKLASIWQKARKEDAVITWNSDQFTEARMVAHLETVLDEESEGDDEEEAESDAGDGAQAGAGEGAAKPAGLAAAAGVANG